MTTIAELRAQEATELREKEEDDARRKATTRGVPFYLIRGRVYALDGSGMFNGRNQRDATEVEQILWEALAVMG